MSTVTDPTVSRTVTLSLTRRDVAVAVVCLVVLAASVVLGLSRERLDGPAVAAVIVMAVAGLRLCRLRDRAEVAS